MNKDPFTINLLLDMYETLLTDKQQLIMQLHYREDLSLAEISEELSISRAGALDHIRRATPKLCMIMKNVFTCCSKVKRSKRS